MTYADSSVIIKRYYEEAGTERVRELFAAGGRVFTSWLAYAEVHAALARKRRERAIPDPAYRRSASAFDIDWPAFDQIAIDAVTLRAVPRVVRQYILRGADAVHLAAALWLREHAGISVDFWASDDRLLTTAGREGLVTVNPER